MLAATIKRLLPSLIVLAGFVWAPLALAQEPSGIPGIPAFTVTPGEGEGAQEYSVTLQILPAMLMMMTSFTRIIVVFAILRQAIGLQSTPSNQILLGLALFLSIFIMKPVLEEANRVALQPYMQEEVTSLEAVELASQPFRKFMLEQTRESDLALFVTSELKTAFQIGFILFIPFLIIDMVVASVLMAMGMMMLSPIIISLPFKIMLFVLVDGWALIMGTLAASYGI